MLTFNGSNTQDGLCKMYKTHFGQSLVRLIPHSPVHVCCPQAPTGDVSPLSLDSGLTGQVEAGWATGQSWADLAQSCQHPGPGHRLQ